jgi:hypothetical protein
MTTANIGIRSGNVIVPYVSTTKRTKEMDFTASGLITGAGTNTNSWGTFRAVAVAYADSTGKWRLNFNISGLCASTGVHTGYVITFSSTAVVVFKNTSAFFQPVTPYLAINNNVGVAYVNPNTADIYINHASYGESYYAVSGDVELESEPTWAAANMEGVIAADVYIAPASGATPGIVDNLAQHFHGVKDFGDGIKLNTGDTLSTYAVNTWTPIVTLVGGSGNTVPVYTTNLGRYTRIGNRVFCEIILSGDGGDEGAGTGTVAISLPFGAVSSGLNYWGLGYVYNSTTELQPLPVISSGASIVIIKYWNAGSLIALTGAGQNNASRGIQISIVYEAV